jgi:3-hexulose-6-phosphate synthase/6-phospho-3-hexuloisomerase
MRVPVMCGGQQVSQGDYIVADESGIVVIPKNRAAEIARKALYVKEREERIIKEIEDGKTVGGVMELDRWEKVL